MAHAVQRHWAGNFSKITIKLFKEKEKVKQNMKNLKLLNSRDDLTKLYPYWFKQIGKFPGIYHIYLREDAIPVVNTPRKCPTAIRLLVDKKLDKLLEQKVIVPLTEPTDQVSLLAYLWKADGDLRVSHNPRHLNKAIRWDHYRIPTLEEITHELAGSTKFTKLDGSYHCIVLDYESSLLTTFSTHTSSIQTCMCTGYLPEDDAPNHRSLWRSYQNCRWYNHTW